MAKPPTTKTPDWKAAVADGKLKFETRTKCQAKGIKHNALCWINDHPKFAALVAWRSDPDFSVSKTGLEYGHDAEQKGWIKEGYVLLLQKGKDGKNEFVNVKRVGDVMKILSGVPTRLGDGEYWFVDDNFRPVLVPSPSSSSPFPD